MKLESLHSHDDFQLEKVDESISGLRLKRAVGEYVNISNFGRIGVNGLGEDVTLSMSKPMGVSELHHLEWDQVYNIKGTSYKIAANHVENNPHITGLVFGFPKQMAILREELLG